MIGGAIAGGLAGLVLGYDQTAEWATNVAQYMNNASHLWAPVAWINTSRNFYPRNSSSSCCRGWCLSNWRCHSFKSLHICKKPPSK